MYTFGFNARKLSLWILFIVQILMIASYFFLKTNDDQSRIRQNHRITFLTNANRETNEKPAYRTETDEFPLRTVNTNEFFVDFNSSLCFVGGTDLKSMTYSRNNWKCVCLPGWHGTDCGQPEVLLRALLAHKKIPKIKGPRMFQRRLIYIFQVDELSDYTTDIKLNELGDIIDVFVLYEPRGDYFERKLNSKFCKEFQHKIIYVQNAGENVWGRVEPLLRGLHRDDVVIYTKSNEIPNRNALVFLKFYDNFPEPIRFRLRWSVFGFFWTHPAKTVISGGACTVAYLKDNLKNQPAFLIANKTYQGIIFGDLNHTGGWFCEYCSEAPQIVHHLVNKTGNLIRWEKIGHKINMNFIETLVENGLYVDSKTELVRAHKYSDNDFAPPYVLEHEWKYDILLINFYSQTDYYES